jgi:hypothetical protein
MAWLWENEQEYKDNVQPVAVDRHHGVRHTHQETWFALQAHLHEAATKLQTSTRELRELHLEDPRPSDPPPIEHAERLAEEIVYSGELLLLYHKRLALSDWAYDFLTAHDMTEHWERYAATRRIINEVNELIDAADKLLQGYHQLQNEDERFLGDLDLPEALQADFTLSRNLFSIGLDDLGVFAAGRGLEGVLRAIARRRKLTYQVKGKNEPLQDADFHDLTEAYARIKLANGTPLIDKEARSLLEFARTVRNATAHPGSKKQRRTAHQLADVIAHAAQHLWTTNKGARLSKTQLIKNW